LDNTPSLAIMRRMVFFIDLAETPPPPLRDDSTFLFSNKMWVWEFWTEPHVSGKVFSHFKVPNPVAYFLCARPESCEGIVLILGEPTMRDF